MLRSLLILVALSSATTVHAQERLAFLVTDGGSTSMLELDVSVSDFGTVRALTPVPDAPGALLSIPFALTGGRYVAWVSEGWEGGAGKWVQIFDRQTRTTTTVALTGSILASNLLADPLRPRVFSLGGPLVPPTIGTGAVYVYDVPTGVSRGFFPGSFPGPIVGGFTYAAEADQLIAWRSTGGFGVPITYDIAVLDVFSNAILRTFPFPNRIFTFSATRDGRRLYAHSGIAVAAPIVAYDLIAGQEIARSAPIVTDRPLLLDEQRGLVLVALRDSKQIAAFDAATLATLGTAPAASSNERFAIYPGRGLTGAYIFRAGTLSQGCPSAVDMLGPDGLVRSGVDLAAVTGGLRPIFCAPEMAVLLQSPSAPSQLTATVNGGSVTLAWRTPGDVTAFELQVGLTPGTTLLRVPLDAGMTTVSYSGVPPGVFYARVIAVNETGVSPSSNEVRIEVR